MWTMYPMNLINSLISSNIFFRFFEILTYAALLPRNKKSFIYPSTLYAFYLFFLPLTLARTSGRMLDNKWWKRTPLSCFRSIQVTANSLPHPEMYPNCRTPGQMPSRGGQAARAPREQTPHQWAPFMLHLLFSWGW